MGKIKLTALDGHKLRTFFMASLLGFAASSAAQEVLQEKDTDSAKDKKTLIKDANVGFDNFSALDIGENTTTFYNNFQPQFNASVENAKGDKASISALELVIYDGNTVTPILTKLMAEFYKKIGNDGELFLKIGRENTQGGDVFPNTIAYFAESDIVPFGNKTERMVLGYKKGNSFVELGTIQNAGEGKYVIMPNMKEIDFWGKGHLSLLSKCGMRFELEGAARLGEHGKLGILSTGVTMPNGLGAKALVERDFKENDNKYLVNIYKNLKDGSQVIANLVHSGKGKGLDIRCAYGKDGAQVFAQYNTVDGQAHVGVSYVFGKSKKIFHR